MHIESLKELETKQIKKALIQFSGNKAKAAEALGISRAGIYNKIAASSELRKLCDTGPKDIYLSPTKN